ncbi:hypothetical protein D3Z36_14070 [Lachnospiraceae bacterium]|nr:hypothetical protein [Lachnospiraceae bacterium]
MCHNNFEGEEESIMEFNGDFKQFVFAYNGLIFASDEKPEEGYLGQVKIISENYFARLNQIIHFVLPEMAKLFGNFSVNEVKEKLGEPVICYDVCYVPMK